MLCEGLLDFKTGEVAFPLAKLALEPLNESLVLLSEPVLALPVLLRRLPALPSLSLGSLAAPPEIVALVQRPLQPILDLFNRPLVLSDPQGERGLVLVGEPLCLLPGLALYLVDLAQELLLLHRDAFLLNPQLLELLPVLLGRLRVLRLPPLQLGRLQLEALVHLEQLPQVPVEPLHLNHSLPVVLRQLIVDRLKLLDVLCLVSLAVCEGADLQPEGVLDGGQRGRESLSFALVLHVLRAELEHLLLDRRELELVAPPLLLHGGQRRQGVRQAPVGLELVGQEPVALVEKPVYLTVQEVEGLRFSLGFL